MRDIQTKLHRLKFHALSDVGLIRDNNEDAWLCMREQAVFIVADGLGGHQAGEVASKEALDFFKRWLECRIRQEESPSTLEMFTQYLLDSLQQANQEVYALAQQHHLLRGMGTTFSLLSFFEDTALVLHVGDSRIYVCRDQKLKRLTQDHLGVKQTTMKNCVRDGAIKGYLTKALGTTETIFPQCIQYEVAYGDIFLLCSDGLSDMVSDDEIESVLIDQTLKLEEKVRTLIHLAKTYGGQDNITVLLVELFK